MRTSRYRVRVVTTPIPEVLTYIPLTTPFTTSPGVTPRSMKMPGSHSHAGCRDGLRQTPQLGAREPGDHRCEGLHRLGRHHDVGEAHLSRRSRSRSHNSSEVPSRTIGSSSASSPGRPSMVAVRMAARRLATTLVAKATIWSSTELKRSPAGLVTPTWLARPRPARRIGTGASVVAPPLLSHESRYQTDR